MWKIKTLKSNGKASMKRNYTACLIVSLIMIIVVSGILSITDTVDKYESYVEDFGRAVGSERIVKLASDIKEFETKLRDKTNVGDDSSAGVISNLYHSSKKAGSVEGGIMMVLNNLFLGGKLSTTIITTIGVVMAVIFGVFVQNILRVGASRFFLENKTYSKTSIDKLLTIYRVKRVRRTAWTMFVREIYISLWFLTIIGGIIKFYQYRMMPFILAENPNITRKEAFDLSIKMMKGNKFKAFLLDLSFVPWWILAVATFGIVQYLYLEPYTRSAYAELYLALREEAIEKNIEGSNLFTDKYLTQKTTDPIPQDYDENEYPAYLFTIPAPTEKKAPSYDYHRKYVIYNLVLMFFAFALVGWLWECSLEIIQHGRFVNRGSLYGPWVPIYGFGGVGMVIVLRKFVDHPIITFLLGMLFCGILEGATGWYFDAVRGMKYWDYSGFYFNINGYVCLEGLLVFGIAGVFAIYFLAPMIDTHLNKLSVKTRITMSIVLVAAFLGDNVYTHFNPHVGEGVGGYVDNSTGGTDAL